jgi:hypothetical protein
VSDVNCIRIMSGGQEVVTPIQDKHFEGLRVVHDLYQCVLIPASIGFHSVLLGL